MKSLLCAIYRDERGQDSAEHAVVVAILVAGYLLDSNVHYM